MERVAEHFYSEKSKGKTVSEMNISVEYAFWEQLFREEDAAASVKEVDEYLRKTSKAVQSKNRKPNRENNDNEPDLPEYDAPTTSAVTATVTTSAPVPNTCDAKC